MKVLISDFGTDHFYAADGTFSHAAAPWASAQEAAVGAKQQQQMIDAAVAAAPPPPPGPPIEVDMEAYNHSKAAYAGMTRTDPKAIWIYQTWSWLGKPNQPGGQGYMKGWITAVPNGSLILLDLMAEENPLWKKTASYYGAPFIWCMLNDFGGNNGMWGDFLSISTGPSQARAAGATMVGVGLTPEGIFQNPVVFDLMNENAYRHTAADLPAWTRSYASRRYGPTTQRSAASLAAAWAILLNTTYSGRDGEMISKDTVTAIPYGRPWDKIYGTDNPTDGKPLYDNELIRQAWHELQDAVKLDPSLANRSTFVHDLADLGRQTLAKHSSKVWSEVRKQIQDTDLSNVFSQCLASDEALSECLGSSCRKPSRRTTPTWCTAMAARFWSCSMTWTACWPLPRASSSASGSRRPSSGARHQLSSS